MSIDVRDAEAAGSLRRNAAAGLMDRRYRAV
jgi:hypothetical protein